jgi:HAD superfamily hydrolase (TIGR01549 family)
MFFPKQPKPRPILFDLGDTLINFKATNPIPFLGTATELAYNHMRDLGFALPSLSCYLRCCKRWIYLDVLIAEMKRREVDLVATLFKIHRSLYLPREMELLMELVEHFYEPMRDLGVVEEGIHQILDDFVAAGHPMAIVSNTMVPGPVLDRHLEQEGLLSYFPVRVYSSDVGVRKPRARMFRVALMGLNVKPQDSVFVGDRGDLDVKGAKRLGMITVLKMRYPTHFRWGSPATWRRRLRQMQWPHPSYVVRHLTELPKIMRELGPC